MAIINHPRAVFSTGSELYPWDSAQVVQCDCCSNLADRVGKDAGEAADVARSLGFTTVRGKTLGSPREWRCPGCSKGNSK
jgi:hypothetical protein